MDIQDAKRLAAPVIAQFRNENPAPDINGLLGKFGSQLSTSFFGVRTQSVKSVLSDNSRGVEERWCGADRTQNVAFPKPRLRLS